MKKCIFYLCCLLCVSATIAHADLSDIEAAVMNKNYEQARVLSTGILKNTMDPSQRAQARYYLGLSQLRLGQYARSRQEFQALMRLTLDSELYDKAALGLIEGLYMANFYKDALKEGNSLLRKSARSQYKSLIYLKIARAHLKLMQWQEAKDNLQRIITEYPQSFEAPIAKNLLEEKEFFAVQVGSFLDQDRAIKLSDELKSKGQYAYVVQTTSTEGKIFYRVRVGQVQSLKDAHAIESKLSIQGYPTLIYP